MATGSPDDVLNRVRASDEARIEKKRGEKRARAPDPTSAADKDTKEEKPPLYMIDRGDDGKGKPRIKRLEWDDAIAGQ